MAIAILTTKNAIHTRLDFLVIQRNCDLFLMCVDNFR